MKKWYAVIGDPIEHSLSPLMHNTWFETQKIDASYLPIHVKPQELEQAVASLKLLDAGGWNVTIPHKEKIIPLLDVLDDSARRMGAVNTVVRMADGRLKGYNTDGLGFVRSLEEQIGSEKRQLRVLIIGAGGAARGIAFALESTGYSAISICNRTVSKAETICCELSQNAQALSLDQASQELDDYDIIVQTTPAGLKNGSFELPFNCEKLKSTAIVADIVYNPLMTALLKEASKKGATVVTGIGMFIHQGALAYSYWTGNYPDIVAVKDKLLANLGGN
ncbi:shikimate dehydrogenase [Kurthia sibirica]|uniref:Shikimate dehydrogenase (NADP(+)) n=1 Tax=Kurthia sibirica TaxID=202750 RepID=A0A2U3AJY3_9BACL|nr:shikimate dehydrogenase [Kurthia sibirica]PWI24833.1 shikimate dehydrogenase [Kurthia sibirica]GEK33319.1 shikimate dehydrogenase (NADP(+)) [Kurthia sibirica]